MTPLQLMRRRPEVVAGLLAAVAQAWWWTVSRMSRMDAGPGPDLGTLGWFIGSRAVMMAAMMLPLLARNGGWCVGSSWVLMVALFALGVMSLIWMALVAALVVFEKLGPWPRGASVATASVLVPLTGQSSSRLTRSPGLWFPDRI